MAVLITEKIQILPLDESVFPVEEPQIVTGVCTWYRTEPGGTLLELCFIPVGMTGRVYTHGALLVQVPKSDSYCVSYQLRLQKSPAGRLEVGMRALDEAGEPYTFESFANLDQTPISATRAAVLAQQLIPERRKG